MRNFCLDLRENVTKIINYEKKEMILLTDEENKSYKNQKCCYICKKILTKDNEKVKDHFIILENTELLLTAFVI